MLGNVMVESVSCKISLFLIITITLIEEKIGSESGGWWARAGYRCMESLLKDHFLLIWQVYRESFNVV